jgi:vesicle coat complex subunit
MSDLFEWLSSLMLLCLEIVHILLASIALSYILHEVSIVHCVSHLSLVLTTTTTTATATFA